ncbi:MAG: hypothetical protein U5N86_11925 [Planctomycetota bacterium]|nr:hypothetical protein [Planctomycetota bacterium]
MNKKKEAAKSILTAIGQREQILLRIGKAVADRQREYFLRGRKYIRPLLMKDLADELGIDVSTVSRAVSGKYMDCPQGIVPLREMFTAGYTRTDGAQVSDEAIKEQLKRIVAEEDKSRPLSDQAITDILKKDGVEISRRTVTKYREELEIPNAPHPQELLIAAERPWKARSHKCGRAVFLSRDRLTWTSNDKSTWTVLRRP